jgi:hypothetical protein
MHLNRQFGTVNNKQANRESGILQHPPMEAVVPSRTFRIPKTMKNNRGQPSSILRGMAAQMYTHLAASDLGYTRN